MNIILRDMLDNDGVKFNKSVLEGLSTIYLKNAPDYLDAVIKSAMNTLAPELPLVYKGYRRLTPLEDFYNNINAAMTKDVVDISINYLYKVAFGLELDGESIERVIALPYVDEGGYMKLSDANYGLVPVLSEYPISPAPGEVFIRLLRDKLIVKRMERKILIDGEPEARPIIFSKSYKLLDKVNDVVPQALYMFVKHGFYGAYEKYFKTKPILIVGDANTDHLKEEYVCYTTLGVKPKLIKVPNYIPHTVKIFIKRKDITPFLETVMASLIYSFDIAPQLAGNIKHVAGIKKKPETDLTFNNIDDESIFWITLLGRVIFKNKYSTDRIQVDMLEHINILNGYLDNIVKEKLTEIDIYIDDFYELTAWVIEHFNELTMNSEKHSSDIKNRYLDLPYYVLFDLIVGINKAFLEIKRAYAKDKLTLKEGNRIFNNYFSTKRIYGLINSSGVNLTVVPLDYSGDSMYFKMTSILEDYSKRFWSSLNVSNCGNPLRAA